MKERKEVNMEGRRKKEEMNKGTKKGRKEGEKIKKKKGRNKDYNLWVDLSCFLPKLLFCLLSDTHMSPPVFYQAQHHYISSRSSCAFQVNGKMLSHWGYYASIFLKNYPCCNETHQFHHFTTWGPGKLFTTFYNPLLSLIIASWVQILNFI